MSEISTVILPKKRRARRKKRNRPKLDFVESPQENFTVVEHPDFGEPIEFPTAEVQSTQWISPQIKKLNQSFTPKRSRMCKSNKNSTNRVVTRKKVDTQDVSSIAEYNEEESQLIYPNRMKTRSLLKKTPERKSKDKENLEFVYDDGDDKDDFDSPMPPSCLSTPDLLECKNKTISSLGRNSMHFLFRAQTPVVKDCIVLVENTPI